MKGQMLAGVGFSGSEYATCGEGNTPFAQARREALGNKATKKTTQRKHKQSRTKGRTKTTKK